MTKATIRTPSEMKKWRTWPSVVGAWAVFGQTHWCRTMWTGCAASTYAMRMWMPNVTAATIRRVPGGTVNCTRRVSQSLGAPARETGTAIQCGSLTSKKGLLRPPTAKQYSAVKR